MTLLTSLHEEVSLRSLLFWYTSLLSRSIALPPSPSFPVQEIPFYNVENGRMNPIPALLAATRTLYLFTKSDVKTILLPVTVFATIVSPLHWNRIDKLPQIMFWIWIHLLQFCVSNQSNSPEEDSVNKPWRPIPAGRISLSQTRILRYYLCASCLALSLYHNILLASILICLSTVAYNDLGLHRHMVWRNVCNAVGYASFELGATQLAGSRTLPFSTIVALGTSSLIISTTIQAADFRDEKGDRVEGKQTFPIVFPELSRVGTSTLVVFWSNIISTFWNIDVPLSLPLISMALVVACRFYCHRNPEADKRTYLLYNIWLSIAHICLGLGEFQARKLSILRHPMMNIS